MAPLLVRARTLAASLLRTSGQDGDAQTVLAGGGDDFVEVRVALQLLCDGEAQLNRYERALQTYADPSFWEAEIAEGALAYHDGGEVARSALAGKELFQLHRD